MHIQPARAADAHRRFDGVVIILTYDPRMRLTSHAQGNEVTVNRSEARGLIEQAMLADEASLTYTRDADHRLDCDWRYKGNRIDYTLDALGNRTAEQLRDPGGALRQNIGGVIDALNRVERIRGLP